MALRAGEDRVSPNKLPQHRASLRLLAGAASMLLLGGLACGMVASAGCSSSNSNNANCSVPNAGCACDTEGVTVACSETIAYISGSDSAECKTGTRTCSGGSWSACVGDGHAFQSVPAAVVKSATPSPCVANPCDPTCSSYTDNGSDIEAGPSVSVTETGGISIAPGDGGFVFSDGGGCTGLECRIDPCGGDFSKTQLTGHVYDPAGLNPIPNVTVYIPNAPVTPFTDGVACSPCVAPSGSPIVSVLTDYTGAFTLKDVPSGASVPIVIQSGKWRRQLTLPAVTKCVSNPTDGLKGSDGLPLIRFPKNRSEGDIPRIAYVSGGADPFECIIMKMGMDVTPATSEVGNPNIVGGLPTNPDRIHYYNSPVAPGQNLDGALGGGAPNANSLWASAASLGYYDAIINACEGGPRNKGSTVNTLISNYIALGGRMFATHFSYTYIENAPAASLFPNTVQAWSHQAYPPSPIDAVIDRSFPKGDNFAKWLNYVGASPTLGILSLYESRHDFNYVNTSYATHWMFANSSGASTGNSAGAPCTVNGDCASNSCVGAKPGVCADFSSCYQDADCTGAATCSTAADCPSGFSCTGGGGWWGGPSTCSPSGWCNGATSGTCAAAKSCTTNADCASVGGGSTCAGGTCTPAHDMEPLMTFNVPVGAPAASQCGRVVYSDFHVSANALNGIYGTFPYGCNGGALSSQEKALEYMLFDLTACLTPDYVPPTTAPPFPASVTVTRQYTATCAKGFRPQWHFFDYLDHTPGDSSIVFKLQTGDTPALAAAMTPIAAKTVSGAPNTVYGATGNYFDVHSILAAQAPPVLDGLYLNVVITLNPTSDHTQAPTLDAWRQAYDCVASE